ncbi:MAG: hypothetical protein REU00_14645 [Pseudomonadota bacterium]|nr:hypothetical protein [Pseudomonadota bacterium]
MFTTTLLLGIGSTGCTLGDHFEHTADAEAAAWDGEGDHDGLRIKCKGAGVELLDPALGA